MAGMQMQMDYPNDNKFRRGPFKQTMISGEPGNKEEASNLGIESYDHMMGRMQPAHLGSQSSAPDKEDND